MVLQIKSQFFFYTEKITQGTRKKVKLARNQRYLHWNIWERICQCNSYCSSFLAMPYLYKIGMQGSLALQHLNRNLEIYRRNIYISVRYIRWP